MFKPAVYCFRPSMTTLLTKEKLVEAQQKHDVFFAFIGKEEGSLYDMLLPITKDLFTKISFYTISSKLLPKASYFFGNYSKEPVHKRRPRKFAKNYPHPPSADTP